MKASCILPLLLLLCLPSVDAADWLTLPSHYTHDLATGLRVTQFAPVASPTAPMARDFRSSGYVSTRSSLNYGQSADNYHRVEQWGPPVLPYGEWRFPNRPYSAPYSQWGAPFAGLGSVFPGVGFPGYGFPGNPSGTGFAPGGTGGLQGAGGYDPYPIAPGSAYPNPPYFDGYHPVYRD